MANGYIGKISAVVTANTSDLSRKLQGAVKDVDRFAQTLNRSVSASAQQATASLEKIFTPLQRLERKLQTALQLNLRTDDEVRKIQQLVSVSEGINKPLERAAGSFSKLSLEVQGAFLPALNRAQDAAVNLSNTLQQQGSVSANSFKQVEQVVNRTAQALQRLTQAQQLASQSLTGNELQFGNPRLFETLTANAQATRRAAALPAAALEDGSIARQIRALQQYQNAAVEAEATVSRLRLDPSVNPEVVLSAERRLVSLVETARRAGQELERATASAENPNAAAQRAADNEIALLQRREQTAKQVEQQRIQAAQRAADNEIALLQRREQTARQLEQQRLQAAQRAADNEIALLIRREQAAKQAEQAAAAAAQRTADNEIALLQRREQAGKQIEQQRLADAQRVADNEIALVQRREQAAKQAEQQRLAAAQRAADNEIALLQRREQAAKQIEDERAARAQRAADNEIALIIRREQAAREAEARRLESAPIALGNRLAEQGRRRVQGRTGDINIDSRLSLGPDGAQPAAQAQRDIDALAARVGQVRQQLETLPNSVRTQFIPALQQAQQQLIALQNSPRATADQIERAAASVKQLEDQARRTASALALPSFSEFSDSFSTQRAVGELQALQQVLAGIGATAGGPAARAYEVYRVRLQEAIRTGTTGLPRVRAEIEKLQAAAAQAAAATGRISFANALRQIQRGGDLARGAFGNLNLVVTQAAFAVDDFFSATGGIEQRLRAVGNNISQIGFLLGSSIKSLGLWGIAIGVGVNVVAQLGVAIFRWANSSEEAEKKQKQLEAAIKQVNAALERQLQITESLASAYKSVANAAAASGLSDRGQRQRDRRQQVEDIQRQQEDRRREVAVSVNPRLSGARARVAAIEEQLQTETNERARRRLGQERDRLRGRIESDLDLIEQGAQVEIDTATRRAGRTGENARQVLEGRREGVRAQLESALRTRDMLQSEGTATPLTDKQIERLSELLSRLEVAILKIGDEAAVSLGRQSQVLGDQLGRAQANIEGVRGFSNIEALANAASQQIEQTLGGLADGEITSEAAQVTIERLKGLAAAFEQASIATREFYGALEDAAGNLARQVEQELQSRGESIRRQANAAEAQFGEGSQQADLLRNAQDRIEAARQDSQEGRQSIERQIEARRASMERELLEGRGSREAVDLARRARLAQQRAADESLSPDQRTAAQLQAGALRDQLRNLLNQDAGIQGLRERADQIDVQAQREQQQVEQAIRGRELSLTPGQRAGEALASDIDAIRQFYGQLAEATTGLVDFGAQNEAIGRLFEQTARGVAPAIFALQDSVANAVLQGPSRAALEATDVSTVEGARELNRLLRGDDAARNQDLVELQKQSAALEELVQLAREQGVPGVAN